MTITIQWIELENKAWESAEGRFYIEPHAFGYALNERTILYSIEGTSQPEEARVSTEVFASVDECKRWAHRRLEISWGKGQ